MLFAIAFFGALLLIPLYYQTVRGASALEAGLLLAPQGVGAMITMPLAGKLPTATAAKLAGVRHPAAGDRPGPVRLRHRPHLLRPALRLRLRPRPRHGLLDDADDDRGACRRSRPRDRPHVDRDEHHPSGRRLDRHRDPLGHPHRGRTRPTSPGGGRRRPRDTSGPEPGPAGRGPGTAASAFASTFVWALVLLASPSSRRWRWRSASGRPPRPPARPTRATARTSSSSSAAEPSPGEFAVDRGMRG